MKYKLTSSYGYLVKV